MGARADVHAVWPEPLAAWDWRPSGPRTGLATAGRRCAAHRPRICRAVSAAAGPFRPVDRRLARATDGAVAMGRDGLVKGDLPGSEDRADSPIFAAAAKASTRATTHTSGIATADAVIDTTGTYGSAQLAGSRRHAGNGRNGRRTSTSSMVCPTCWATDREHYASRNVLLVGDGDSAVATSLVALAELAAPDPRHLDHLGDASASPRRSAAGQSPVDPHDPHPERSRLARQANQLAADDANHVTHLAATEWSRSPGMPTWTGSPCVCRAGTLARRSSTGSSPTSATAPI